tara:strand:- start:7884 stop:8735 length:852 start_codon:yes stop_codon:yes gene_type:complete
MNIFSLQSQVVYGHVGNSAAIFPLQRLGHEVWGIPTVLFSNHPKHEGFRGRVVDPAQIRDLAQGLDEQGCLRRCDAVLSGYLGNMESGQAVQEAIRMARTGNPGLIVCCDPVMGHEQDGFFVSEDLRHFIRDQLIPSADIITPNQFETEYLVGHPLGSLSDALAACDQVRDRGPKQVVVTSLSVSEVAVDRIGTLAAGEAGAWLVTTPRLSGGLFGAGDLFAALLLGNFMLDRDTTAALRLATASTYGILAATVAARSDVLELIPAQNEIVAPSQIFEVVQVA